MVIKCMHENGCPYKFCFSGVHFAIRTSFLLLILKNMKFSYRTKKLQGLVCPIVFVLTSTIFRGLRSVICLKIFLLGHF
jgi:hypothetical protein